MESTTKFSCTTEGTLFILCSTLFLFVSHIGWDGLSAWFVYFRSSTVWEELPFKVDKLSKTRYQTWPLHPRGREACYSASWNSWKQVMPHCFFLNVIVCWLNLCHLLFNNLSNTIQCKLCSMSYILPHLLFNSLIFCHMFMLYYKNEQQWDIRKEVTTLVVFLSDFRL